MYALFEMACVPFDTMCVPFDTDSSGSHTPVRPCQKERPPFPAPLSFFESFDFLYLGIPEF
jgi:hypothetical protein